MQDPNTGLLKPISQEQFLNLAHSGVTNVVMAGDVFKIRGCFFRVTGITENALTAAGITRRTYLKAKATMPVVRRIQELPDEID